MRNVLAATMIAMSLGGCQSGPEWTGPPGYPPQAVAPAQPAAPVYANPIFIPIADPQCAWEQVADVVDNYFRIDHEEPARINGNTATEGTLTTMPEVSPTIFEPWRRDTVDPEQRVENTLQTMRRWATVRVIPAPAQGGTWVDIAVFKELEDLPRPEHATAGIATARFDSSLTRIENPVGDQPPAIGWIKQGRDTSLEQYMIAELLGRVGPIAVRR